MKLRWIVSHHSYDLRGHNNKIQKRGIEKHIDASILYEEGVECMESTPKQHLWKRNH
jgi:hypothetical protein